MSAEQQARVLVREAIAEPGLSLLREHFIVDVDNESPLEEIIGDYDAIIIRSATQLTAEVIEQATRLKIIGRAGVGIDNVDLDAATRHGIVVANAPESTVVSAAEHTIGLLLALARNLPQAHAALKQGRWERAKWGGVEVAGKTLAILGFGRIGQQVSRRALGLQMRVLAYDPFIGEERFRDLGVERVESFEELLAAADFLTLHSPATSETKGLINRETLALLRPGSYLVNAARGSLVDEEALYEALESGQLAGAALDVYSHEPYSGPLLSLDNIVVSPHLAASTDEAQDRAGLIIAEQVAAALAGQPVQNALNLPALGQADLDVLSPYAALAEALGRLVSGLAGVPRQLTVATHGPLSAYDTRLLTASALRGLFAGRVEQTVNLVNAPLLAQERGVVVREERSETSRDFSNTVELRAQLDGDEQLSVAGSVVGPESRLFLSSALGRAVDIELGEHMVFASYSDQPGVIGRVGTMFGAEDINIANMAVSRDRKDGQALMVFSIDTPVPAALAAEMGAAGFDDIRIFDA